ncbi:hypothetical protein DT381_12730 [Pseudomonas aeruginosa]|uniref:type II toxin-antitoxin system RelE/ParE family toxin n=1 Tax=Pseudomonas aeruginosa TaxID=287 RepID=UPI00071B8BE2|nr:type II toxin-antitoxin system RelE/ParE family toxin [Pseudomonas aeruginosa]KSO08549.1 hypothetical protein APA84_25055 [Pseudomonas aeruginosa]RCI55006.1 hypothetical protein DT381_12730 [Pseudomonas aeruginosa]HCF6977216.1 type II toxin-antitoxin system RelE/ParE family toxin [Pseudomonas aeruginosa]HEJ2800484.1 type II toxin-antitoxin system RelE/ParE family toxin [Pseudomonas aeruginosa]HEP8409222.1 type II toxin-antitoxin system RelE/ParE family toxin [Pseudomonas aeruginosa]
MYHYIEVDIVHVLIMHPDAEDDLQRLCRLDKWSAARILALLEELNSDQDLLDRLSQHGYQKDKPYQFDVSRWQEACGNGYYLLRIKAWGADDRVLPYRVIYAHVPTDTGDEYHILAIAERSWDYNTTSVLSRRIFKAYEDIQQT